MVIIYSPDDTNVYGAVVSVGLKVVKSYAPASRILNLVYQVSLSWAERAKKLDAKFVTCDRTFVHYGLCV